MTDATAVQIAIDAIVISAKLAGPTLLVSLVVGVFISLVQTVTSIQEMTLTFVPKLAAILAVFWLSMGFMTETLTSYFQGTVVPLIAGG